MLFSLFPSVDSGVRFSKGFREPPSAFAVASAFAPLWG
jgi:hypothetical protein